MAAVDLISGTCAGLVSVLACHPLDTVRVRLQTAQSGRFSGVVDVVRQTMHKEGLKAFYKGLSMPLCAQGIQKATMFVSFGAAKRAFQSISHQSSSPTTPSLLPLSQLYVCGAFAGTCNALVAGPFELVRNRLQVQYERNLVADRALYTGPIDCASKIVRTAGIRSLWLGLGPMILRDAPGVGAWYATFEGVRRLLLPPGTDPTTASTWKVLVAGASAGVSFWIFAFPQDCIKSVIQTRGMNAVMAATEATPNAAIHTTAAGSTPSSSARSSSASSPGFFATGAQLVRSEGIGRLWRGFSVAAFRGIPGASSTFLTYSIVSNYLNQHWK